jgi:hypothetical protein
MPAAQPADRLSCKEVTGQRMTGTPVYLMAGSVRSGARSGDRAMRLFHGGARPPASGARSPWLGGMKGYLRR